MTGVQTCALPIYADHFRRITSSALEGLARRELNLSAIVGRSVEAKERRLVPEIVEQFFVEAASDVGLIPRPIEGARRGSPDPAASSHVYRIGKVPRNLIPIGDQLEPRFGRLGREYGVDIIVRGHTHERTIKEYGGLIVVNPGSSSIPKEGPPSAAIIDTDLRSIRILNLENRKVLQERHI